MPWLAYQETIVWVTSCGCHGPPLMPHRVLGFLASVTSARTGLLPPCKVSTASFAVGDPAQLACMAAQAGTSTGGAVAVGEGGGVGVELGVGVGVGDGLGEAGAGERFATKGPFAVQPATAASRTKRTTPILTVG